MAQLVTFQFGAPNSTRSLNDHIAKLLGDGPYHGMEVIPFGPGSMKVSLTAGYLLTKEGVKVEEQADVADIGTVAAADLNYPRNDIVVLHHKYDPAANPNIATYRIITGNPRPPAHGHPLPPDQDPLLSNQIDPLYDYVIADIFVRPGENSVLTTDIFNRYRVLTTPELRMELAEALFMAVGNFCYEGWNLSSIPNTLVGLVSKGRGLLCGLPGHSIEDQFQLTTLRAREWLYAPVDPLDNTTIRHVGDNLTLDQGRQPYEIDQHYATKLRITVSCEHSDVGTSGNVVITGVDEFGEITDTPNRTETLVFNVAAGAKQTVESVYRYRVIEHEGIDAGNLIRSGKDIRIQITDKPIHYIYAVGTQSSRVYFRAEMDPNYVPLCNEYLLGWMETDGCDNAVGDPAKVILIKQLSNSALAPAIEVLTPYCNGINKSFSLSTVPRAGTGTLIMDGFTLRPTLVGETPDPKGYQLLNKKEIVLGSSVPAPDADTDIWFSFIRA